MDTVNNCPVCGAKVDEQASTCSECGFNLTGTTESFDPLELSSGEIELQPTSVGVPQLTLIKGPSKGGVFFLEDFPITVGRDTDCDIFLNNRTVSRHHAIIERMGDRIVVRDNHSLNGTWVDERVVEEAVLTDGCVLQIGTFTMRFNR